MGPVMAPASPARTNFIRRNLRGAASRRVGGAIDSEEPARYFSFPWGKVAARQGRRMRGGRDLQLRTVSWPPLRGAVCAMDRLGKCASMRSGELDALRKGFPWRRSCQPARAD